MLLRGNELAITASIGGCVFPQDGDDAETLIMNADTAMYQGKALGRNNSQWFPIPSLSLLLGTVALVVGSLGRATRAEER
jgi:predicted signal transduction protein with EAL and GGDEF domain